MKKWIIGIGLIIIGVFLVNQYSFDAWIFLLSYLLGSIPSGYLIAKKAGINIRLVGSGNIGATNVARILGLKIGLVVLLLDALKAFIPVYLAKFIFVNNATFLVIVGAVSILGHIFPIYLGFTGGRGVACALGVMTALLPYVAGTGFIIWFVVLAVTRYVSIASLVAVSSATLIVFIINAPPAYRLLCSLVAIVFWLTHLPNIKRLIKGKENRLAKKQLEIGPDTHCFGFVVHPETIEDVYRKNILKIIFKYLIMVWPPCWWRHYREDQILKFNFPIVPVGRPIQGIVTKNRVRLVGYLGGILLLPRHFQQLNQLEVLIRIAKTVNKLGQYGASIVGLGAHTSTGDKTAKLTQMVNVPITSGNTFTVATSLEGIRLASQKIKSPLKDSCLGVVGIPGSIATTCARIMAKEVNRLVLIGRPGREEDLQRIAGEISQLPQATKSIKTSTDPNILKECQYIITVTSSINPIIEEKYLSPGTVICDVARPRDTFESLQNDPNFLVFEGGLVRVPGQNVDLGTNITGLLNRHDITFACEAETMMLAASGRLDLATISNEISENNVLAMALLAQELGFETVGLRGVWDEQIVGFMELRRIRARKEKINA